MCRFLPGRGTHEPAVRSAVRNHTSWMTAQAEAGGGGPRSHGSLRWIVSADGGSASLPFPDAVAGDDADAMLADCRARDQTGIGCWTSGLDPIGEIAAVLVARGFEWGWSAHWMAFDLDALPVVDDDRVRVGPRARPRLVEGGRARRRAGDRASRRRRGGALRRRRRAGHAAQRPRPCAHRRPRWTRRGGGRDARDRERDGGRGAAVRRRGRPVGGARADVYPPRRARGAGAAGARRRGRGGGAGETPDSASARGAGRPAAGQRHGARARRPGGGAHRDRAPARPLGAPLDAILAYELDGADGLAGIALDEPIGRLGGTVLHEAVRIRDTGLLWAGHLRNPEAAELLKC